MNNTLYDVDFTRALPEPLKNDETMLALGKAIAGELQENIRLARFAILYPRIDELPEDLLDILARDFHVDWYEDTHPIAAKRQVIKDSVKVHKRLGTKYAIVTALGSVFPHTEVQEWYEYGGTHHRFRIIIDMTNANAPADFYEILRAVNFYKRLTAHLDEIIYQMSAVIEVSVETTVYRYRQGVTGTYNSGTEYYRYTRGVPLGAVVEIDTDASGAVHQTPHTGTKPHRSTIAALNILDIVADNETAAYNKRFGMTGQYESGTEPYRTTGGAVGNAAVDVEPDASGAVHQSPRAGTKPDRSTRFTHREHDILADLAAEGFTHTVNMTDKTVSGTEPYRMTAAELREFEIIAENEARGFDKRFGMTGQQQAGEKPYRQTGGGAASSGVDIKAESEGYTFSNTPAGTEPHRTTGGGVASGGVDIEAESGGYIFNNPPAGTKPHHNMTPIIINNDVFADATAEAFLFAVEMTGKATAGTDPQRNTVGGEKTGALNPVITAESFFYRVRRCGTSKTKNE